MSRKTLYSLDEIKETYKQVHDLLVTKYIIKKYSTNKNDIRDVAINGIDLSPVRTVLDLGCGYGFFIEKLQGKLNKSAHITGIDIVDNNKEIYLHNIETIGYKGEFLQNDVRVINTFEDAQYDLIIASYSLYFFPYMIRDIARLVKNNGFFITLTHSNYSLHEIIEILSECMKESDITPPKELSLYGLLNEFSYENGKSILENYFNDIEIIEFKNAMKFSYEHIDDCIYYIEKKRTLLFKEAMQSYPDRVLDLEMHVIQNIYERVKKSGEFTITKDDAIFRCYKRK